MIRILTIFAFAFLATISLSAQNVIWGDQPGEGDFDGGLNGWTVDTPSPMTDSSWAWSATGDVGNGLFAAAGTALQSATIANGCAVYNYDFMTTGGTAFTTQTPMTSHLVSPVIDISGVTKSLTVEFTQLVRWFQSADGVGFSNLSASVDGGMTWSEYTNINGEIPNGSTLTRFGPTNNTKSINIPAAFTAGADSLQFRFTFAGNFYYWALDDVVLKERVDNDLSANPFFAIAPSLVTPASQLAPIGFLIDVENLGHNPAANVMANVDVSTGGTSVFTASNPYGDLQVDTLAENSPFPTFLMDQELDPGVYDVTYSVSSDSMDNNMDNQTQTYSFAVSDTVFSKEDGPTHFFQLGAAAYDAGDVHSVYYGAFYRIPNGDGWFASKATISVAGASSNGTSLAGNLLTVKLYEWVDANEDLQAQETERTIAALGFYEMTGNEGAANAAPSLQSVDLVSTVTGEAPALKDDMDYILMMEYDALSETADLPLGITLANDYTGNFVLGDQVAEVSANHSFIKVGSTETEFGSGALGYRVAPVARLAITDDYFNAVEEIPGLKAINLSPNPTPDMLNIEVESDEPIGDATVIVLDVYGDYLFSEEVNFGQSFNRQISVAHLPSGQYYLGLKTDKGQSVSAFQVIR